jgi:hypothetical protein
MDRILPRIGMFKSRRYAAGYPVAFVVPSVQQLPQSCFKHQHTYLHNFHFKFRNNLTSLLYNPKVGIAGRPGFDSRQGTIFIFSTASKQTLGPIQSHIQWVRWAHPQGYSGRSVKLTTHLHLVPRSRMVELYLHSYVRLHGIVLN